LSSVGLEATCAAEAASASGWPSGSSASIFGWPAQSVPSPPPVQMMKSSPVTVAAFVQSSRASTSAASV
jgi:hypothetical protein